MKVIHFFIFVLITINTIKSQNSYEKYLELRQTIDTLKVNEYTFNELFGTQIDEIFMDFKQINEALKIEIDSVNKQKAFLEQSVNEIQQQYQLFLYITIAASSLLLILIFICIFTLFKHGKTKKLYNQALLEIGKLNADIEKLKQNYETEKEQYNLNVQKFEDEKQKISLIAQRVQEENLSQKNEIEKLQNELKTIQQQFSNIQSNLLQEQTKCEELSAQINEFIDDKNEKEALIKKLSEQLAQYQILESQYQQNIQDIQKQIELLKKENETLKIELQKSLETEEKVNIELKNFIAELQAMLPLPKNG